MTPPIRPTCKNQSATAHCPPRDDFTPTSRLRAGRLVLLIAAASASAYAQAINDGVTVTHAQLTADATMNPIVAAVGSLGVGLIVSGPTYNYSSVGGNSAWLWGNANLAALAFGSDGPVPIHLITNGTRRLAIGADGNVGIGTSTPTNKLTVIGTISAKEIKVTTTGADYVFEPDYRLRPLGEVEQFIKREKHLPEMMPARQMQAEGMPVSEVVTKQLAKIEELTLYVIELNKENDRLKLANEALIRRMGAIEQKLGMDRK